ncbi:leader peptidase (prepilin peptidase)/N-methyltransferase [Curtobacterium flaccumfaciens]|uniref:Prepilin leader peptidase/N-methyltransferase n=1 Tax=Curtobacterium flaccumfaciens TaxID=2035 RepID=A0A4R6DKD2_9MICO|nr:A24 family peptidase [Curtobacterium flaccumfaciens]TDN45305.1 leader peptidase (prepilin peptidase)/N-methyltransferase [Curtobacterium flaccumfaciens]
MSALQQIAIGVAGLAGVFGLLIGSFLNVVVYRVPAGLSVVNPPSACPKCGHEIRGFDNVPVLSWLVLRGACRDCGARISARYPLVEAATAGLFAVVAGVVLSRAAGAGTALVPTIGMLVVLLYLMGITVALALIDLDTHRLPDKIVLPAYVVLGVLLTATSAASGDWWALGRAAIGMAVLVTVYFGLAVAVPGGMGMGDVKLAGVLGFVLAYLGWGPLAVGAFGGFALGAIFAIGLLAARRAKRGSGIPFGPWMLAGAWLGILCGGPVWDAYLGLIGLT